MFFFTGSAQKVLSMELVPPNSKKRLSTLVPPNIPTLDSTMAATGVAATVYIRITEGDGSRYVISETIDISLVPRGGDSDGGSSASEGLSTTILAGIGAAILLILVVVVTLVARGRSKDTVVSDTVEQFGGVETMDPVEAYVQQMVASGYDEQQARAYAEQYYASYYEQQRQGGA